MKKTLVISMLFFAYVIGMYGQSSLYEKFSDNKNISSVYISKALLSMISNLNTDKVNLDGVSRKVDQIEIYTGKTNDAIKLMKSEFENIKKNKSYEVLMQMKDGEKQMFFYAQEDSDNIFKDLLMFTLDSGECSIIYIMGSFTAEDIQSVMNQ